MNKKHRQTNNKIVRARKKYTCDCCGSTIKIGDNYKRINSRKVGIFHFCSQCDNEGDIYSTMYDVYRQSDEFLIDVEEEARREGIDTEMLISAKDAEARCSRSDYIDYGDEW